MEHQQTYKFPVSAPCLTTHKHTHAHTRTPTHTHTHTQTPPHTHFPFCNCAASALWLSTLASWLPPLTCRQKLTNVTNATGHRTDHSTNIPSYIIHWYHARACFSKLMQVLWHKSNIPVFFWPFHIRHPLSSYSPYSPLRTFHFDNPHTRLGYALLAHAERKSKKHINKATPGHLQLDGCCR